MQVELVPLVLLAPVLIATAISDLRWLRIPNTLVLIALAIFAVSCPFLPIAETGLRLLTAAITLVVGFALFSLRLFGGGDVKMFAALMLFVPSQERLLFMQIFAFSLLLGSLTTLALQSAPIARQLHWESTRRKGKFPMGISIALAGLLLPVMAGLPPLGF